ncbi:flagellar hook-associated protein FlgL [Oceanobacillus chungangensis]|uniref:Flagellar hook-associated protein FlgL n=1 Tax=Oceanobacillus chungangensis TaxID=1229152 RepID=A0A3D8PHU4_9BACI|nr:flagellar hook-associated protein FlgL [Oceanobacillus chungangensis]RDW15666.1 flagellar hook-associated protein FlgL [Oceanobacillus chungangensis]
MRITQSMISNNMLKNLTNSYSQLDTYMNQLSTGKKINKPSDNPVLAMNAMGYRTELLKVEQYQQNTNEVHNWYDNSDAALNQATQAMQRLRDLAVQASNDTYGENERKNIAEEVKQIKLDLIDIANTKVNDKYIFNGTNTAEAPITKISGNPDTWDITYNAADYQFKPVNIEISDGSTLQASVDGNKVFGNGDGGKDLFTTIDDFITKLEGDETLGSIDESLGEIDLSINNIINARADLGAKMNRLELVENRLNEQEIVATKTMSNNEDIDYAEVITKLITQESLHRAALSAGARIIQPTLLDFLR